MCRMISCIKFRYVCTDFMDNYVHILLIYNLKCTTINKYYSYNIAIFMTDYIATLYGIHYVMNTYNCSYPDRKLEAVTLLLILFYTS